MITDLIGRLVASSATGIMSFEATVPEKARRAFYKIFGTNPTVIWKEAGDGSLVRVSGLITYSPGRCEVPEIVSVPATNNTGLTEIKLDDDPTNTYVLGSIAPGYMIVNERGLRLLSAQVPSEEIAAEYIRCREQ